MMTPVESAFKLRPISLRRPDEQKFLEVCEVLVECGTNKQDGQILLEGCVKAGNEEMTKRRLDKGIRIRKIPICSRLEIVRLLLGYACQVDSVEFQRYAVEHGLVDLLRFLVNRDGSLLPRGDFEYIASRVILGGHLGMLRYLVFEYGLDINGTFPSYPGTTSCINLLQRACNTGRLNSVELLLALGADVDCPWFPDTVLVVSGSNSGSIVKILPMLQLKCQ